MKRDQHRLGVVVTTYNRPSALAWVLAGLACQTRLPDVIVIADDGSLDETRVLIDQWRSVFSALPGKPLLLHYWQPDEGFRAAAARNGAVRLMQHESLVDQIVFLDGDCIPPRHFLQRHANLIGRPDERWSIAGGRGLLTESFTAALIENPPIPTQVCDGSRGNSDRSDVAHVTGAQRSLSSPFQLWRVGRLDRWLPMLNLPQTLLGIPWRDRSAKDIRLVRTCNYSAWSADFERVAGFDERFVGWGLEDSEFAARLVQTGVRIRSGRMATNVLHLWHPEASRDGLEKNRQLLNDQMKKLGGAS